MSMLTESQISMSNTMASILCCMCGIDIKPNPANMCMNCIRDNFDITDGINKQVTIHSCRSCGRFLLPPWQEVKLESKELMSACLRKIPGLSKVKLIDAAWIWTEPHSMRLKIKLTIQKEIMNGAVLQQSAIVEFIIRNQQCTECQANFAQGSWQAVVQVRQRVSHKRTFLFLEQLLLKHHAHSECINIVTFKDGIDFYFTHKQHSLRFIDFLSAHIPMKSKYSRKLVSADHKSNIGKFKHNFIVEIAPVCKDDLLLLPNNLAKNLSNICPLVVVKSITSSINVIDPITGERQEIDCEKYWRYEFTPAMSGRDLVRFLVLSIEPILASNRPSAKKRGLDRKLRLAECIVVRESDFGMNDTQYTCTTHLGHILKEGDIVMGFDLAKCSLMTSDKDLEDSSMKRDLPDVILVRKLYRTKGERFWHLKSLQYDEEVPLNKHEQQAYEQDYEHFLQEIEGDKELRTQVNIYKKSTSSTTTNNMSTNDHMKPAVDEMNIDSTTITTTTTTTADNNTTSTSNNNNNNKKVSIKKKTARAKKNKKTASTTTTSTTSNNKKRKNGSTDDSDNDDEDDNENWVDMEGEEEDDEYYGNTGNTNDEDDEAIQLDELLDEMTLSLSTPPPTTTYTTTTTTTTTIDNNSNNHNSGIMSHINSDVVVLSVTEASSVQEVPLPNTGFDEKDYDFKINLN